MRLTASTCRKNLQKKKITDVFSFSVSLWETKLTTIILRSHNPPNITDHCPLFCMPIKRGSLMATVHSGPPDLIQPLQQDNGGWPRPFVEPLWWSPEKDQIWVATPLCDWCRPDPISGLSQATLVEVQLQLVWICLFKCPYLQHKVEKPWSKDSKRGNSVILSFVPFLLLFHVHLQSHSVHLQSHFFACCWSLLRQKTSRLPATSNTICTQSLVGRSTVLSIQMYFYCWVDAGDASDQSAAE